jgi:hypothetical protein
MRFLICLALCFSSMSIRASDLVDTLPHVELGAATQTSDGFRVRVKATTSDVTAGLFTIWVPQHMRDTELDVIFLDAGGDADHPLIQVPVERSPSGSETHCTLYADRRMAAKCVLHFQYKRLHIAGSVKDYVVRLKYHLP